MPLPIYTCGHALLPLPMHSTYPPPTHLPHLCRACHYAVCQAAMQDVHEAYDHDILRLQNSIRVMEESLGHKWDLERFRRMEHVREQCEQRTEDRHEEIRKIWIDFDRLWGGPF